MDRAERNEVPEATLPRVLGLKEAYCVVVGCVIGSGIFMVPATVARDVPFVGGIALVWVVGGLFSLAGALTLAELGAMLPRAGGLYVYLREAYGPRTGFLFGWTEFWVIRTGSMATLASAFARYFVQLVAAPAGVRTEVWQAGAAVAAIAIVATVNVLGTALGGRLQVAGTAIKVGGIAALIALPVVVGGGNSANLAPAWPRAFDGSVWTGMMTAMVGVLWAYDGWVNLTPLAEEVREPGRNIPRALLLGMASLIAIYLTTTLAYHLVLSLPEVAASSTDRGAEGAVAARYCSKLVGRWGVMAISILVMTSIFIALNGNALTGPRAYFAMARDGLFPAALCRIHPRFQTPSHAVVAQAAWAILLTLAGTVLIVIPPPVAAGGLPDPIRRAWAELHKTPLYDVLYTYVIFGATLFTMLAIASVFVLRARRPDLPRPYRTWGYPVTPLLYVVASLVLLASMLRETPAESFAGLLIILLGLPAYAVFARRETLRPPNL